MKKPKTSSAAWQSIRRVKLRSMFAGLKSSALSETETSRRETSSEGVGDTEALPGTSGQAAPEEASLSRGPAPLQTRRNPERRLREQQFAQEARSTQWLHRAADEGSQESYDEIVDAGAAAPPGAALSRYISTSQQVASALAASRAQPLEMGSPALPDYREQALEQELCIQELKDKVSRPPRSLVVTGGLSCSAWPS